MGLGSLTMLFNRRKVLALGAGAVGAALIGSPALAKNDSDDVIKEFTGGKKPVEGKVKLDLPRSPRTATPCR